VTKSLKGFKIRLSSVKDQMHGQLRGEIYRQLEYLLWKQLWVQLDKQIWDSLARFKPTKEQKNKAYNLLKEIK